MSALAPGLQRAWRFPRLPLGDWLFIALCGWITMLAGLVVLGVTIDNWAWIMGIFGRDVTDVDITTSIWAIASGIAIWFIGFVGGYYLHNFLPAFVAAGRTRRSSALEAVVFGGTMTVVAAILVLIGYLWERMVYAIAGWSRGTPDDIVQFTSYNDYGRILVSDLLAMMLWVTGGALIGSSFYRDRMRGAIAVAIALVTVSLVGGNSGLGVSSTFLTRWLDLSPSLALTAAVTCLATGIIVAITWWWNVQRLPLRNK